MNKKDKLIKEPAVLEKVQAGRSTLRKWLKEKTFPAPVKLPNSALLAWRESDIDQWIAELKTEVAA